MSSRTTAKIAFAIAVILLLFCGAAAMIAVARYSSSAGSVDHTYDVKVAAGRVESTLAEAARDRLSYITSGDPGFLDRYQAAKKDVLDAVSRVRQLTLDNPIQGRNVRRLDELAERRLALLQTSLDARASGQLDAGVQSSVSLDNTKIGTEVAAVIQDIQNQEDALLAERKTASSKLLILIFWIFAGMLAAAILLLWVHYRFLNRELGKRENAESSARRLSVHVLELQDEERRRFSRELHDGLGQILTLSKMLSQSVADKHPDEEKAAELVDLLDRSIQETRTISYLLHPPLLDELGIASAANWYLDGFSKRSGVQVSSNIARGMGRLPRPVELVLFRVLQESLTNVHRHAKCQKAEVAMHIAGGTAVLRVRDDGMGIPIKKLQEFQSSGAGAGVGLTGMRERVREHGGKFEIHSSERGTEVVIKIPLGAGKIPEAEVVETSGTVSRAASSAV